MILIVICCACDSKFKAEDNDNIRSKTSIAPFLTQFHVSETNNMQKTTKKVNYWKAPLIEEKEDVVYDVMTEQLLDDLKSAINDFSIDDKTKALAILKIASINCKKADLMEVFDSILFLHKDVRDKLITDILATGTYKAKNAIVDVLNWIKDSEELDSSWIKFLDENDKSDVEWTDDVLNLNTSI